MRDLPPPAWLRTFEAAARHMSFTEAAAELHVTQSAVSQHIRLLEDRLGHALFHRLPRGLRMTEAGKAYLPVVHEAFERLKLGTEEVFGQARDTPLTVRATPGFIELWLGPRLERLFERQPELDLRITSIIWNTDFVETGVDLEIRYGDGEWSGLAVERLTQETLFPVCTPALAEQLRDDPGNLNRARVLHTDGFMNGWPEWLRYAGVDDRIDGGAGCHFDTAVLPVRMASAGLGVALGRSSLVHDLLANGDLVAPFAAALPTEEAFFAAWPDDAALRPEALQLLDWLRSEAAARTVEDAKGAMRPGERKVAWRHAVHTSL